jgi:hypothetical protein
MKRKGNDGVADLQRGLEWMEQFRLAIKAMRDYERTVDNLCHESSFKISPNFRSVI